MTRHTRHVVGGQHYLKMSAPQTLWVWRSVLALSGSSTTNAQLQRRRSYGLGMKVWWRYFHKGSMTERRHPKWKASCFWTFSRSGLQPPCSSILDILEVNLVSAVLDTREVTFSEAKNSNIYPILRQNVLQNFWNMVNPTPPFNVPKRVKIEQNKATSKLLYSCWTPTPLLDSVQKKDAFHFGCLPWVN